MTDRVCLLTGASGLLGTAFIERHFCDYRIVALVNRSPVRFATAAQVLVDPLEPHRSLPENRRPVLELHADLLDAADVERAVGQARAQVGDVDLVINAAAYRRWPQLLAAEALDAGAAMFGVNVLGPLRVVSAVANTMWSRDTQLNVARRRNVVNVSSAAGLFVYPDAGQGLYSACKAALNQLTYHMASELWDLGIRANAIAPDTFPGRVGTARVLEAIRHFDDSEATGEVSAVL